MKGRLVNLLAAALVALAVSTTIGGASPSPISTALYVTATRGGHATPPATHGISTAALSDELPAATGDGPSDHDRLAALIKRVDALSKKLAVTTRQANTARNRAENANDLIDCIATARRVVENANGELVSVDFASPSDLAEFAVPVYSESCLVSK